jgi:hypothetical protein
MEADGKTPNEDYLDMFLESIRTHRSRFDDPERRENNLEYDLLTTDWILEKVRASEVYAQNLYAAMCNNSFLKLEVLPILTDTTWSCSWRYAGGIIADMRQQGDYIDWYCSGIRNDDDDSKFVSECVVTDEIRADLLKLGWKVINEDSLLV